MNVRRDWFFNVGVGEKNTMRVYFVVDKNFPAFHFTAESIKTCKDEIRKILPEHRELKRNYHKDIKFKKEFKINQISTSFKDYKIVRVF